MAIIDGSCCPPFCPPPDNRSSLSPPIVNALLYECATTVSVKGFVPGANIDIYANGATRIGGGVSDSPWGQVYSVSPTLAAGQNITATQSVSGSTSLPSQAVAVTSFFKTHPEGLPKPRIETPLYDCGGAVGVNNLAPGGLLEVFADNNLVGKVDGCGAGQWLFVNPLFVKDQKVFATEKLCQTTGPKSDTATVLVAPGSLPAPIVREVYEGGKYCTVDNITNGALVEVYNSSTKIAGHYCSGGSQAFRLNPQPAAGDTLRAVQKLCNVSSPPSDPTTVEPCSELPAPKVLPICKTQDFVMVEGTVMDARIRVYANGVLIGDGGGSKINLIRAVAVGEKITATQSLGTCTSPLSTPVEVKVSGAPPYEPSYWNDPSFVRCNNCYNYGCNIRTDTFAQPGYAHGVSYSTDCLSVGNAAKADGLADLVSEKGCGGCTHKVALVIAPGGNPGEIWDYHWYRLDDTGRWSHKPASHPATDVDASGNLIPNPETANRKYVGPDYILDYRTFCTYYCVDKDKMRIEGWRQCN